MGICLSKPIKADSSFQTDGGVASSKMVSGEGTDLSNSSVFVPKSEDEILQSSKLRSFTFDDVKAATMNFRTDNIIGEGSFGFVFKGWIDEHTFVASGPGSGIAVAIKMMYQQDRQGHKEWLVEINYLGQLHHPNLAKLIGYCLEDHYRLLVYEFMPRGSLENHIFIRGSYFQPLSWSQKMNIALGAARGLAFLHSDATKVIYRDCKASNILLDLNYNAKLSNFGLARDGPTDDKSHVTTQVTGSYGYTAPECLSVGHVSAKSDVYSFGVVLLEILLGRKTIDINRPLGEHNLAEWAKAYLTNKNIILQVLDAHLGSQYSPSQAVKAVQLALQCIATKARLRPNMDEVVKALVQLQSS